MKILMVLTSHDQLGSTGRPTGFWLEEFAAPYFVFRDAGVQLTLASPKGGQPPVDPKSDLPDNQTDAMARFKKGCGCAKGAFPDRQACRHEVAGFRLHILCGRARAHVGPCRKRGFHRSTRVVLHFRQADFVGVSFARSASARNLQRRTAREGEARYRLYQRRRGRYEADTCGAIPGRE